MLKKQKIRVLFGILLVIIGIFVYYVGVGVVDYYKWIGVKKAVAEGGFPWQCGASEVIKVQEGCVITAGECSCPQCQALCNGSAQVDFVGQESCGVIYACIDKTIIPSGGPLLTSKQLILAGSSNMMTGNAVLGTQSVAANRVERVVGWFNNLFIAGFKE